MCTNRREEVWNYQSNPEFRPFCETRSFLSVTLFESLGTVAAIGGQQ